MGGGGLFLHDTVLTATFKVLRYFHEWQVHRYSLVHNVPAQVVGIGCLSFWFS